MKDIGLQFYNFFGFGIGIASFIKCVGNEPSFLVYFWKNLCRIHTTSFLKYLVELNSDSNWAWSRVGKVSKGKK